jgi:hypothetical protein
VIEVSSFDSGYQTSFNNWLNSITRQVTEEVEVTREIEVQQEDHHSNQEEESKDF